MFQVQSDIASRVAEALGLALGAGEEKRLAEKPTQNLAAYDAFLKGEEATTPWPATTRRPCARRSATTSRRWRSTRDFAQAWARVSRANSVCYY